MSEPTLPLHTAAEVPERSKAFWAKCEGCGHCWAAAYYPQTATNFAKIASRNSKACPKCGSARVTVAKQSDGVLQEMEGTTS